MTSPNNTTSLTKRTAHNFRNLEGYQFGRLVVLSFAGKTRFGSTQWLVRCECGVEKVVRRGDLTSGSTVSCGHVGRRRGRPHHQLHGGCAQGQQSPEYVSYRCAKQRCTTPTNASYVHYGGRGIEFRFASFQEFLADIGKRPSLKHSLDRIDVDGHYEPGNVRWATPLEQAANKRR